MSGFFLFFCWNAALFVAFVKKKTIGGNCVHQCDPQHKIQGYG